MTALEKIQASDYSPAVKAMAAKFDASLQWFAAAREAFEEGRPYRFLSQRPCVQKVAA